MTEDGWIRRRGEEMQCRSNRLGMSFPDHERIVPKGSPLMG